MVRRKETAQKNTLRHWAGIDNGRTSSILIFHLPQDKLRDHQRGKTRRIGLEHSLSSSDSTITDLLASQPSISSTNLTDPSFGVYVECTPGLQLPKKVLHPFFIPKSDASIKNDDMITNIQPSKPHSFFDVRARKHAREPDEAYATLHTKSRQLSPMMPSKNSMHVCQPVTTPHNIPFAIPRTPRPGQDASTSTTEDWLHSSWWKHMQSRMQSAKSAKSASSPGSEQIECPRQPAPPSNNSTDQCDPPGVLWTTKYRPRSAEAVLQADAEALLVRDWLKSRNTNSRDRLQFAIKKNGINKYADEYDDFIIDHSSQLLTSDIGVEFDDEKVICPAGRELLFKSNVIILTGPPGCGKSALVHAIAHELEYEIFEVNSSDKRSAKDVLDLVGEAADSHIVNKQKSASGSRSKSLILFEEVDILYREDRDFWSAVLALISRSRRPVILTCNDTTLLPYQLDIHAIFVYMSVSDAGDIADYLESITHAEGVDVCRQTIEQLTIERQSDLRACIMSLQFISLKASQRDDNLENIWTNMTNRFGCSPLSAYIRDDHCKKTEKTTRDSHRRYRLYTETLSLLDVMSSQQRSSAFEAPEAFETEDEESTTARCQERDDVLGRHILSDPQGRYTQQHPGDIDFCAPIAMLLDSMHVKSLQGTYPIWHISTNVLPDDQMVQLEEDCWLASLDACEPFAVRDNWMHETISHSTFDRPRQSGILSTEALPYLREIARVETMRSEMEAQYMQAAGRQTRNTMALEMHGGYIRPPKIPDSLRGAISATFF